MYSTSSNLHRDWWIPCQVKRNLVFFKLQTGRRMFSFDIWNISPLYQSIFINYRKTRTFQPSTRYCVNLFMCKVNLVITQYSYHLKCRHGWNIRYKVVEFYFRHFGNLTSYRTLRYFFTLRVKFWLLSCSCHYTKNEVFHLRFLH